MDSDERKWQRIRDVIVAEGTGKQQPRIASTRTLFGIPSSVDEAIATIVKEEEERQRAKRTRPTSPHNDGKSHAQSWE